MSLVTAEPFMPIQNHNNVIVLLSNHMEHESTMHKSCWGEKIQLTGDYSFANDNVIKHGLRAWVWKHQKKLFPHLQGNIANLNWDAISFSNFTKEKRRNNVSCIAVNSILLDNKTFKQLGMMKCIILTHTTHLRRVHSMCHICCHCIKLKTPNSIWFSKQHLVLTLQCT